MKETHLSKLLRDARISKKIKQREIAAKLSKSTQLISQWEHGVATPTDQDLESVSKVYFVESEILNEALKKDQVEKKTAVTSERHVFTEVVSVDLFLFLLENPSEVPYTRDEVIIISKLKHVFPYPMSSSLLKECVANIRSKEQNETKP